MKQETIQKIDRYLLEMPDTYSRQIISFIGYLKYQQRIDSDYPYPDEIAAIEAFRKSGHTVSWDEAKQTL